jgi:hypothetical protein
MYCTINVLQGKRGQLLELQGKKENGLCNVHGLEEKWGNVLELQERWDDVLELGGKGEMYWNFREKRGNVLELGPWGGGGMGYSTEITGVKSGMY